MQAQIGQKGKAVQTLETMTAEHKSALVLAAGLGTRLGPLTHNRPKALLEIEGRSLLEICLRKLEKLGYTHVVVNTHHFHDQIEAFVRDFESPMSISLSHEREEPLETGGGLLNALPFFQNSRHILVHNVDVITDLSINELYDTQKKTDAAAVLAVSERPSTRRLLFDSEFRLAGWKNAQSGEVRTVPGKKAVYDFAFSAVSYLNTSAFEGSKVRRVTLVELLLNLAENHEVIAAFPTCSYWHDLGKADQLAAIAASLKEKGI